MPGPDPLSMTVRAGLTFGLLLSSVWLNAEESGEESPHVLEPIVVVANKVPRALSSVAAQVTVIDADAISSGLVEDIDGLLRYQPGLDVQTAGTRFGASSINIRGVGGNRVDIRVDGVPMRDMFAIGAYSNGGRTLVETDRIKRVEVLHGPASAMYGSNALGGVLAITTLNPSDLLATSRGSYGLGLRAGYQGIDDSWLTSGVAAWGQGNHALLVAGTYRQGHELDNQAPAGTPADPQDWDSTDFMFRYTYDTSGGSRLRISAERTERKVHTEINSQLGYGRRFRWTTELLGDDRDNSRRLFVDYDFSIGQWEQGLVRVYDTDYDTDQKSFEERAAAPNPVDIRRRFRYQNAMRGVEAWAFRQVSWGQSSHRIGLGGDYARSDISEIRDGLQTSLIDGSSTNYILGEAMPVRDFPKSRTDTVGLWIQDEISLANGRWEIIPALRWDRYDLDPQPDDIWLEDNPNTGVVKVTEGRVTPKLGLIFHLSENWSVYGQYAEGFRAPPFEDANIGFEIPLFGFRAIPNPDLKSETSQGVELGLRRFGSGSQWSMAVFNTEFDDFIESRALIGVDPGTGDLLFQSRNIESARIRGIDIRFDQELVVWSERLDGWRIKLAAWYAKGDNRQNGEALNAIAPPQAVLGLAWNSPGQHWELSGAGTFTARKSEGEIDQTSEARFATPSWFTVDLSLGWRPVEHFELRLAAFNLLDETYWRWLDIARLQRDDPMIPLLSRPGRSFSVTARYSF